MANRDRLYFYAPTWDFPPDGPIRLGNVLTSVKKPDRPLACRPPPGDSDVFRTEKRSVHYTREKLRSGQFSVLTKFLGFLGFGVDVGVDFHRSDEETFTFGTVETAQFVPTPSYLQSCVESDAVLRYLQLSKYRKPLYIITGVKVVTGAEARTLQARSMGGSHALEVDGTVWSGGGVPVAVGPGLEGRVGRQALTQWEGASDFVFAFRVSKVVVDKATVRVRSETEYRDGAMLGDEAEESPSGRPELSVLHVPDLEDESQGFDLEELQEGAEMVLCAVPKAEERCGAR